MTDAPPHAGWERRLAGATSVATAALVVALSPLVLDGRYVLNWDSGMYLELAKSLADGGGYAYQGEAHTKFPPGYPLLVAAAQRAGSWCGLADGLPERGLLAAKVLSVIGVAASVLLLGRVALRRGRPLAFSLGVALATLGWWQMRQLDAVIAEPVFAAFQAGTLLAAVRWAAGADWTVRAAAPRRAALLFAGLATMAVMTRTSGVAVTAACLVHVIAEGGGPLTGRLRAAAPFALVPIAAAVLWVAWGALAEPPRLPAGLFETRGYGRWVLTPSGDYTGTLDAAGVLGRVPDLAAEYFRAAERLLSSETPRVHWVAWGILVLGLGAAVGRGLRRPFDPAALTVLATAAMFLLYTWGGSRFLLPVLPLVAGLGMEALADVAALCFARRPQRSARAAVWTPALVAVTLAPFYVRKFIVAGRHELALAERGGVRPDYRAACAWLAEHAAPGDVIVNDEASNAAWLTGRTAWSYPLVRDDAEIRAAIAALCARWLLHDEGREWNGVACLPRDLATGTAPGTRTAWQQGSARIVEFVAPR